MSLSEGNAKTSLEQIPVTESPRPMGLIRAQSPRNVKSVQSVKSVKSVVEIRPTCTLVPGRHYQIVTGGNALGIDSIPQMLPGGQYARG